MTIQGQQLWYAQVIGPRITVMANHTRRTARGLFRCAAAAAPPVARVLRFGSSDVGHKPGRPFGAAMA
jgi:hypothetical protein